MSSPSPHTPKLVTVVLAEDDPGMRVALTALIDAAPPLQLLGVGADATEAIDLVARHRPEVAIVDVTMPGGGGVRATRGIRRECPTTEVLAFSGHEDREHVIEMIRAGACGYLVKGNDAAELVDAVLGAAGGTRPLSRQVSAHLVDELADHLAREDDEVLRQRAAATRIDHVVAHDLLDIAFQPIVDLRTHEVVALEALSRFTTEPKRGPDVWLAEAASVGRGVELELLAVRKALAQMDAVPDGVSMSVNLSPEAASSPALETLIPREHADRVILEITEHAPIDDYDAFVPCLDRVRRLGARIAIDDAGAGFASLRHILRLQPDVIKTDMTLTKHVADRQAERALTRALVAFAAEIGAIVVAEGIETAAQSDALTDLGVGHGQGFRIGRPAPMRRWRSPHRDARTSARLAPRGTSFA